MIFRTRFLFATIHGLMILLLVPACTTPPVAEPESLAQVTPEVIVQGDTPGKEEVQTIELDNCGGKADTTRSEERTQSINVTNSAEVAAKIGISVQAISAEVQAALGLAITSGSERSTSIELVAPPDTRMVFEVVWIGHERIGVVQNIRNSDFPVAFRSFSPIDVRIISQSDIGCPGSSSPQVDVDPTTAPGNATVQTTTVIEPLFPSGTPEKELLYEYTFDNPSGWNLNEGVKIDDGNLFIYPGRDAVPTNSRTFADFIFESRFFIPASGAMAFYLRNQLPACENGGWNCSIQIVLDFKNPLPIFTARRSLGNELPVDIDNNPVAALYLNNWNDIIAVVKGNSYKVYINDLLVLDFIDDEYTSGFFIIDNDPESSSEIKLDYIYIYEIQ